MQVFKLASVDGHAFVNFASPADYEIAWTLNDRKRGDPWPIPNVTTVYENDGDRRFARYEESDNLGMGQCIFSLNAIAALGDDLGGFGEFLPLNNLNGPECFVFLADRIAALDPVKSDVKYFPSAPDRILAIRSHVFFDDVIGDRLAFRLTGGPATNYFTDVFVERALNASLRGLSFKGV